MTSPVLIIVTGPPGSGKTTYGRRLADDLRLPFFSKDDVKETLFDRLGWGDGATSKRLGVASFGVLYTILEAQLRAGRSAVVEANFKAEVDAPQFAAIEARYPFRPIQILFRADVETLLRRYRRRDELGERHPGHAAGGIPPDDALIDTFLASLTPLPTGGAVIDVDTTRFEDVDYHGLRRRVRESIASLRGDSQAAMPAMDPIEAGRAFVDETFPEALAAIVAGSFLRGEGTATSDIDVLIVTERDDSPFRASYRAHGWPIEAFVHTPESWRRWFENDRLRRMPSLPTVCDEGVVVRDTDGLSARLKEEARALLAAGPPPPNDIELEDARYRLTDLVDDLMGIHDPAEALFVAHDLAAASATLLLLHRGRWSGHGKWTLRALRRADGEAGRLLSEALDTCCTAGDRSPLIAFAEAVLAEAGGRLFEGYLRSGKGADR